MRCGSVLGGFWHLSGSGGSSGGSCSGLLRVHRAHRTVRAAHTAHRTAGLAEAARRLDEVDKFHHSIISTTTRGYNTYLISSSPVEDHFGILFALCFIRRGLLLSIVGNWGRMCLMWCDVHLRPTADIPCIDLDGLTWLPKGLDRFS